MAAAAVAFRVSVADARFRVGIRQVVLSLVIARNRAELRSREAILSDDYCLSCYDLHSYCRWQAAGLEKRSYIKSACMRGPYSALQGG